MIRALFFALFCITIYSCATSKISSKPNYQVFTDTNGSKALKGIINRSLLLNDSSFQWFVENGKYGEADASAVAAFQKNGSKITLLVFCGTWCHDSQNLLPKFYKLMDKAGFPESKIVLVAVDTRKMAVQQLHEKFHLKSVPTFIVLVNGKEVGRVEEYGKTGYMEKELGEIVAAIQ
jgi:thiol-disulfide isomerase/thioredoxin